MSSHLARFPFFISSDHQLKKTLCTLHRIRVVTTIVRFSSMFLVRLVRWKQPLRHVRAYNRTNSFFSLCTYTVKQVFSFFSFFSFFPSPSSRVLIVRGFLPRHCYLLSTSTSHGTIGPNISFFVPPWNWIGRLCVFGIYRLFPFLISSRTNLLRPQMEIIIANNFCQRKCTNNCITMLFPRLKNIYQCDIFFEKKKNIFEFENTYFSLIQRVSIFFRSSKMN